VIPFFHSLRKTGQVPITDTRMTRFMITLEQGVELVKHAFQDMKGGEIYVKKIPSMKVTDIASAIAPECEQIEIGIRPGEKLHEQMIGEEDALYTYEYDQMYKILPAINDWYKCKKRIGVGTTVPENFSYTSLNTKDLMTKEQLFEWWQKNK
jgi:FlaA1/EpsC-like NDP-sugar epimerase